MIDEVERGLCGKQNRCGPEGCARGRLTNAASRKEIIIVAFNLPNTVQVRQACLTAVTITAVTYPRSHWMPGACLAYFQIFELGRADYVLVIHGLGHFCDSRRCILAA